MAGQSCFVTALCLILFRKTFSLHHHVTVRKQDFTISFLFLYSTMVQVTILFTTSIHVQLINATQYIYSVISAVISCVSDRH